MFYLEYYDIETYLFSKVHRRFLRDGYICAFDFFSIVRWKSNRPRGKILKSLKELCSNLEEAVKGLTREIHDAEDHENRLNILMDVNGVGFSMATAILAVFYPDDFTVYDTRVCKQLKRSGFDSFSNLANRSKKTIWEGYKQYLTAVRHAAPEGLGLRDMDRCLWTQDAVHDLKEVGCTPDTRAMCEEHLGAERQQV